MFKWASSQKLKLTDEQRQMYAAERWSQFRFLSRIFSTRSLHTLTRAERIPASLQTLLSDVGQFAEVVFWIQPFIWKNLEQLMQPGYPLSGYDALRGSELVGLFYGKMYQHGSIAYRPTERQAVVVFGGSSGYRQGFLDADARLVKYPIGSSTTLSRSKGIVVKVHAGFWRVYRGQRAFAFKALRACYKTKIVQELIITGHSLGAAQSYLFALDILQILLGHIPNTYDLDLQPGTAIKILAFGSPRVGNKSLAKLFRELILEYRTKYGEEALVEYCVRNYADGMSLPHQ